MGCPERALFKRSEPNVGPTGMAEEASGGGTPGSLVAGGLG